MTVCCAQPVASLPTLAVAVISVAPAGVGIVASKLPWASATVLVTDVVFVSEPGWPASMSITAPGSEVPLTGSCPLA